jgi:hypothetical protein
MTETGLIDPSRPSESTSSTPANGDYRYDETKPVIQDSLDAQQRRADEEQRKLKEMKEKLKEKKDSISGNGKRESMDDLDDQEGIAGSPIFSLVQVFN